MLQGSTLTLKETRLILDTGLTVGGHSLREDFEEEAVGRHPKGHNYRIDNRRKHNG